MSKKLTAKQYLSQVMHADRDIQSRLREKENIIRTMVQATQLKPDKVQSSNAGQYDDRYMRLLELDDRVGDKIDEVVELRVKITTEIDRVEDVTFRSILRDRYLNAMDWEEIGAELHYTKRHVTRLHGQALREFERVNQDVLFCPK